MSGTDNVTRPVTPAFAAATLTYTSHVAPWDDGFTVQVTSPEPTTSIVIGGMAATKVGTVASRSYSSATFPSVVVVEATTSGTTSSYTLNVERRVPTYAKSAPVVPSGAFGRAVALSRDGNAVAFGAARGAGAAGAAGQVYAYVRVNGGGWTNSLSANASAASFTGVDFARAVALNEEGTVLAVGDPGANQVAVFSRQRNQGSWGHQATVSGPAASSFGAAVAVSTTGAVTTLVVGAPLWDCTGANCTDVGMADVLTAPTSTANGGLTGQFTAKTRLSFSAATKQLGAAVAFDRSRGTIVLGAPESQSGKGWVGAWTPDSAGNYGVHEGFLPTTVDAGDRFGAAVSADEGRFAVGAPGDDAASATPTDNGASNSGAVYLFEHVPLGNTSFLKASAIDVDDAFGTSVSLVGSSLAVGAPEEDGNGFGLTGTASNNASMGAGAAYVFTRSASAVWTQRAYVKLAPAGPGETAAPSGAQYGASVCLSAAGLVIGAPGERSQTTGLHTTRPAFTNATTPIGAATIW